MNMSLVFSPKERDIAMEFHRGRLVDHIQLRTADLEASKRFYAAVLGALGRELIELAPGFFYADELCLTPSDGTRTHVHLAFQTSSREEVHRFYDAAILAGGRDNGKPGERHYHPGYYAAFVLDPDGNNIEAVYHGAAVRSAPSVIIRA
jgi:catechol 2,3-dioxygenase-like lactoylglutathione lyase family enzyme